MTETPDQEAEADRLFNEYNKAHGRMTEAAINHGKHSQKFRHAVEDVERLWGEFKKVRPTTSKGPTAG